MTTEKRRQTFSTTGTLQVLATQLASSVSTTNITVRQPMRIKSIDCHVIGNTAAAWAMKPHVRVTLGGTAINNQGNSGMTNYSGNSSIELLDAYHTREVDIPLMPGDTFSINVWVLVELTNAANQDFDATFTTTWEDNDI